MKFPFFASVIVFCLVIRHAINRNRKLEEKREQSFWEMENAANATRRKSLDTLPYIRIPMEDLLQSLSTAVGEDEDGQITALLLELQAMEDRKIVNLNGVTNTRLKLTYGVANLPLLTEYDQNYTELITLLQQMGELLHDRGYSQAALSLLTFAIDCGSDIRATYQLAKQISLSLGQPENIEKYLASANALDSPVKPAIVRILQE